MRRTVLLSALAGAVAVSLVGTLGQAAPTRTQAPPSNTAPPTISDTTPQEGQTLTANPGTWSGTQPIVFTYQWRRCNSGGQSCVNIPNADERTYTVAQADVGNTLRVQVTGRNADGTDTATSAQTERVAEAPPPPTGAVPVSSVNLPDRLLVDQVRFSPSPVTSRTAPIDVRVRVLDTRGRPVVGALVFLRSTPMVTTTPAEAPTGGDGWVNFTITPERDFSIVYRRGYSLQFFVRARKPGDNPLAGVSTRRLVQVGIAPAG